MKMKIYSIAVVISMVALAFSFNAMAMYGNDRDSYNHGKNDKQNQNRFSALQAALVGFSFGIIGNLPPVDHPRERNIAALMLGIYLNIYGRTDGMYRDHFTALAGYLGAFFLCKFLERHYAIQNR
jgi:hypothetical protein